MNLVNKEHLKAFVWLRTRLRINQLRKAGTANFIIFLFATALPIVGAAGAGVFGFLLGVLSLKNEPAETVLYAYDGAIAAFVFAWLIGLMANVQRTEGLSIDKLLHLPVSPAGVFLVNYVSSLYSPLLTIAALGFVGLTLGAAVSQGPLLLLAVPTVVAFLFAATAVTYQFQGWLATLMANPRRRRTIIASMTFGVILVAQAPQLVNIVGMGGMYKDANDTPERLAATAAREAAIEQADSDLKKRLEQAELAYKSAAEAASAERSAGKMTSEQQVTTLTRLVAEHKASLDEAGRLYGEKLNAISTKYQADTHVSVSGGMASAFGRYLKPFRGAGDIAWTANAVLPPAWLAYTAGALAEGRVLPGLFAALGLTAVGAWSLRRAYRTTLRYYTGFAAGGETKPVPVVAAAVGPSKLSMAEWKLPWVNEQAAGVATAGFRSLIRAPESKMMLFAPILFIVVFGSLLFSFPFPLPELLRPVVAAGGIGVVLLAGLQLVGNQFGYDRGGFRSFVLAPIPRRDILFGKNLAAAPLILGAAWSIVALVGVCLPMRVDHLLAAVCQTVSMYLMFCLVANLLSIVAPLPVAVGAIQASSVKFLNVLAQMASGLLLPIVTGPTFLPLVIEALLTEVAEVGAGWPIALVLSLAVLGLTALVYRRVLTWEGRLLAKRECDVLLAVTSKEE